jgi:DNA-binding SARP family transcriptional activator
VLEQQGMEAEARGHWAEALELGRRAAQIEALYEEGHRRVMRSWAALGERGLALRHYEEFTLWLRDEVDLQPDPATSKLAFDLRNAMLADAGEARAREVAGTGRTPAGETRNARAAGNVSSHRRDDAGGASPHRSVWTRLRRAVQWRSAEWRDD